jgi:hypothetical protein
MQFCERVALPHEAHMNIYHAAYASRIALSLQNDCFTAVGLKEITR